MARRLTKGRDLVQTKNPRVDRYVMIDRDKGVILGRKPSAGPYKNVPIARRRGR